MENNFKKVYYNKANDLFARLMDEADAPEAPEADEPETDEETPVEGETEETPDETTEEPETDETEGQAKPVEIYFGNLDKDTKKKLMDVLKSSLNASEDDEVAEGKIEAALAKKPLTSLLSDEIVRKLGIKI